MLDNILRKNIKDIIKEYSSDDKRAKKNVKFYLLSQQMNKNKHYISRLNDNSPIKTITEIFALLKQNLPQFKELCERYNIEEHSLLGYDYFKNKDFLKTHNGQ
jgi:hypothetical protein